MEGTKARVLCEGKTMLMIPDYFHFLLSGVKATEATAIGNLSAQMIAEGELKDHYDARNCIYESFAIKVYDKK